MTENCFVLDTNAAASELKEKLRAFLSERISIIDLTDDVKEEIEIINRDAELLNKQAMDTFLFLEDAIEDV